MQIVNMETHIAQKSNKPRARQNPARVGRKIDKIMKKAHKNGQ